MTAISDLEADGFVPFFRSYTKTWIHAVATAGLTAFGTLTIVHNWFAALALASYVVPPVALYLHLRARVDRESESALEGEPAVESDAAVEQTPEPSAETRTASAGALDAESTAESSSGGESELERESEPEPEATVSESDGASETPSGGAVASETADSSPERERPTDSSTGDERDDTAGDGDEAEEVGDEQTDTREWTTVDVPTDATLRDVVVGPRGAYAVGDGGIVLADGLEAGSDDDEADDWTVVLEDGPAAGDSDLRGVDATDDGRAVWVAGDSGALGRIDAETGRHTDYTAPEDVTDNWLGVAVGGAGGSETILLITGSGAVMRGQYSEDAGSLEWTGPNKPGSGSSFSAVAFSSDDGAEVGYCCDTNDGVYETENGGESFERVGLEGADGTLTDVATAGRGDCLVSADDGVVHRYDGPTWTPERVTDATLSGVARHGDRTAVAVDDGQVYEREGAVADWDRSDADATEPLLAVSLEGDRTVAVGESGTVLERR